MLKRLFNLIFVVGLAIGLAGQAGAAVVDFMPIFDTNNDGKIRFGDNWGNNKKLDHEGAAFVPETFELSSVPVGTITISMQYSGITSFDRFYSDSYFAINGYDFAPLDHARTKTTWEVDAADIMFSQGENTIVFYVGSLLGIDFLDLDNFQVKEFSLTYNTGEGPPSGGGDPVPLPSAALLLGCGLVGLVGLRRRRR